MKDLKTTSLLFAVIFLVPILVNYFISMRLYGHWQFSDFYKNIYYWIFIGATIFFKVLVSTISNHRKRNSVHKED
ncbi:hypothetical protein [Aedoeadaptatus urinae]|uniref:hypothetical protein n=1 Tax=Aedoeadaptatus urinae TaxID=1871017 RepID=UPI00097D9496|nr:hypothetical protein [Peptoniphilus urinae]